MVMSLMKVLICGIICAANDYMSGSVTNQELKKTCYVLCHANSRYRCLEGGEEKQTRLFSCFLLLHKRFCN